MAANPFLDLAPQQGATQGAPGTNPALLARLSAVKLPPASSPAGRQALAQLVAILAGSKGMPRVGNSKTDLFLP